MRITFYRKSDDSEREVVSIREAKKLLKEQGGEAWTEHWVGSDFIETSTVSATGTNNTKSRHGTRCRKWSDS